MDQLTTTAIVLKRTDYGEADRILTLLTPAHGKLRLIAKGVRRIKSKLAGGIELFSVSNITYVRGRGDIGTLISARLVRHYGRVVTDIRRVQLGYDCIQLLNKNTEDELESGYFEVLDYAFQALDDLEIAVDVIRLWFDAQLLRLGGHTPNLRGDTAGERLRPDAAYRFDFEAKGFMLADSGEFVANHIKFLRLMFGGYTPKVLQRVQGGGELLRACEPILGAMRQEFLRI